MSAIDTLVYGHAQAKRAIKALAKRSYDNYYNKNVLGHIEEGKVKPSLKLLLVGGSGTGKTHLVRSYASLLGFPLLTLDATSFTPVGATGGITSLMLKEAIRKHAKTYLTNPKYHTIEGVISQMVVFIDEFDKLGASWGRDGNSWGAQTQANFLTLIDDKDEFAGVSWIFAGAFTSIPKHKTTPVHMGFTPVYTEEEKGRIKDSDILKAGIIPEMLGRINLLCELDKFNEEDYHNVLQRILPTYEGLELTEDETNAIVKTAAESELGVRNIHRQLDMLEIDRELNEEGVTNGQL